MTHETWSTAADSELLTACREGDTDAYAVIWERHHQAGEAAARGIAPGLDAGDLVSGAYLKILELITDGRGPTGAFRPYLYRVIRTLAVDEYRSREDTSDELDAIPSMTEAGPWEDGAFDRNAAAQAFAGLAERWQAVLWYTVVEGMPPRKAAALLGMSANSVSALAVRAKEALRSGWVEAHVNRELTAAECQTTLTNLQRYERGKLTAALRREVQAHLERCDTCRGAVAELSYLNQKLALVLAGLFVGGGAAGSLLGAFGQAAPAMATGAALVNGSASAGGSGSALSTAGGGSGSAGGLGAGGSTVIGVLTGPAALIAGAAVAATAVIAGGAVVLSSVWGGSGAEKATAVEAVTSEVQPEVGPSGDRETQTLDAEEQSAPTPSSDAAAAESRVGVVHPVLPTGVTRTPGIPGADPIAPVPQVDPAPIPDHDPEPTPTPEPEPEPDPAIAPGFEQCVSDPGLTGNVYLYGQSTHSGGMMQGRVKIGSSLTRIPLIKDDKTALRTHWWGPLWRTGSITPLSQWAGLTATDSLSAPGSELEIRQVNADGSFSPWTPVDLATCLA